MHTLKLNKDAVQYILELLRLTVLAERDNYQGVIKAVKLVELIEGQSGLY